MAKKTGRGAAALQGASTGAQAGATLGFGVPGAAIGAGLGALGGAIFGGDEAAALRQEELEELRRRQEMGALGLTDEQEAALQGQIMGPAKQLATERSNQMAGLAATQGLGAGTTASRILDETAKDQKLMQDAANKIAMIDTKQRIQDEARISELTGEVSAQQKADQNAAFAGILSTAGSFGDIRQEQQLEALSLEEIMEMRARQEAARGLGIETRGNTVEQGLGLYNSTFG
tara:strand:- start:1931 stop:2626 length:696 start_codon:yes stop_codon:yes gene_type:complete